MEEQVGSQRVECTLDFKGWGGGVWDPRLIYVVVVLLWKDQRRTKNFHKGGGGAVGSLKATPMFGGLVPPLEKQQLIHSDSYLHP